MQFAKELAGDKVNAMFDEGEITYRTKS